MGVKFSDPRKETAMKAYKATTVNADFGTIVFAENTAKAKMLALHTDCCEGSSWIDIRVNRYPMADKLFKGLTEVDWYDDETRLEMVRDLGWACDDISFECEICEARRFCSHWETDKNADNRGKHEKADENQT